MTRLLKLRIVLVALLAVFLVACPDVTNTTNPPERDTKAVELARTLLSGSGDTRSALMEALLTAGFTIRTENTADSASTVSNGMGIAFEAFDVNVLTLVTDKQVALPFADLVMALREVFDEFPDADFDAFIVDGIRQSAQSKNPSLRFWAHFITELGKQGPEGYDLLGDVDTSSISLSVLQSTLISYRLLADMYLATEPAIVPASIRSLEITPARQGCTSEGIEALIIDMSATGLTAGNELLLEYLSSKNVAGAEKAGKLVGRINLALTYIKLAWTMVTFDSSIKMPHGPDLVRTKRQEFPGETKGFVYTARYKMPESKWVNCFRLMLAVAGIDFSLPDDGPIEGASVRWTIPEGSGLNGSPLLVQFPTGAKPNQETNSSGASTMLVEGRPQPKALPSNVREVLKPAKVGVEVSLQPANMFQDLVDAVGASLATLPADLLMRTRWLFNSSLPFTVVDWEKNETCGATSGSVQAILGATARGGVVASQASAEAWTGQADFSYDFFFDDGEWRITQSVSGSLDVNLSRDPDTDTATVWGSPTGTASIDYKVYGYADGDRILISKVIGTGPLLAYDPPEGSRVYLNIDEEECRFNVYMQATIKATQSDGAGSSYPVDVAVANFNSDWIPRPSATSLTGGGAYIAHSESYIQSGAPLGEVFGSFDNDFLAFFAGEDQLGTANVSWSFTPAAP